MIDSVSKAAAREAGALVGLGLIGVGLWMAWPPAALIVVGLVLFGAALWGHFRDPPDDASDGSDADEGNGNGPGPSRFAVQ